MNQSRAILRTGDPLRFFNQAIVDVDRRSHDLWIVNHMPVQPRALLASRRFADVVVLAAGSSGMRENERAIFEQFLQVAPLFAGEGVTWQPGADPPDVLCITGDTRIGVELGEWLDEWQIAFAKREERDDESYAAILAHAKTFQLSNLREVWMVPLKRLDRSAASVFEHEFFAFMAELDRTWPLRSECDDPQGEDIEDFTGYPTLATYLAGLECYSIERPMPSGDWLNMYGHGAAYDPEEAMSSLIGLLGKKTRMYDTLRADQQLSQLVLVLYYDQGWQYNTPYEGPNYNCSDVIGSLRAAAVVSHGQFDQIFLFDSVTKRAARAWP